jgi:hypothetical protein
VLLPAVGTLRSGGDPLALQPEKAQCVECGCTLGEDEAQAVRWGWWSNGLGDLYPYCENCARREFASDSFASER